MTQLTLRLPEAEPTYVTVVIEHGWDDKHDRPRQWCHTLSQAHASELLAEAARLWPGCQAWREP